MGYNDKIQMKLLGIGLLGVLLVVVGCGGSSGSARPMYYYTLDYSPPSVTMDRPLPFVVRVERFTAAPPFDTQRIMYADKGLHRNAYASSRWVAPPGDMLAYLLARDLQRARAFQAVIAPDEILSPTHVVKGWVEHFVEEGDARPAQAAMRVNITLLDSRIADPVARILYQSSYSAQVPLAERTPAALADAMSAAASAMTAEIVHDIYDELAANRTAR